MQEESQGPLGEVFSEESRADWQKQETWTACVSTGLARQLPAAFWSVEHDSAHAGNVAEAAEGKMVSVVASTVIVRKKAITNRCNSRQVGFRTALLAVQANSPYAMTTQVETPVETVGWEAHRNRRPTIIRKGEEKGGNGRKKLNSLCKRGRKSNE